jgi:HAD superfamily hydrolase (TIGR01509 family)
MMRPQVVIFDLGKVLVDFDYHKAGHRIAARGKSSAEEVRRFIDHSPLLVRYESGQITTAQFFAAVVAATHFAGTAEEFAEFFADIFIPMPGMIALHAELRRQGVPTFILSNTNELAISHIRRQFPFYAGFDGYILSYQVGAMKPAEKIYAAMEALTGKAGAELVFIDDRPENIATAAARGWQVILQESEAKTRAQLAALGL